MRRLRVFCCALLLVSTAVTAAEVGLPEIFKRAKDKFAAGDYKASLADFDYLDTMSAQPAYAADRAKLLPVVTFYRGANLAALGRKPEAKDTFVAYLSLVPTAAIASPPFPKSTVDLFEEARKEARGRSAAMGPTYAAFAPPPGWVLAADEHWIESPVRYLLTPAQKKEYATFTTNAERAAFVEAFWKQLDPTPATDVNEFRNEFERRVAFADANFATEKQAGRFSDRAPIFVFLGPPTYAATSNLTTSDDAMASIRKNGNDDINRSHGTKNAASGFDTLTGQSSEDNLDQAYNRGTRESWVYRQDRIPKGIAFQEVHFQFQTKQGYGTGVLQKEAEPMQTLGLAVDVARRDKRLN